MANLSSQGALIPCLNPHSVFQLLILVAALDGAGGVWGLPGAMIQERLARVWEQHSFCLSNKNTVQLPAAGSPRPEGPVPAFLACPPSHAASRKTWKSSGAEQAGP